MHVIINLLLLLLSDVNIQRSKRLEKLLPQQPLSCSFFILSGILSVDHSNNTAQQRGLSYIPWLITPYILPFPIHMFRLSLFSFFSSMTTATVEMEFTREYPPQTYYMWGMILSNLCEQWNEYMIYMLFLHNAQLFEYNLWCRF